MNQGSMLVGSLKLYLMSEDFISSLLGLRQDVCLLESSDVCKSVIQSVSQPAFFSCDFGNVVFAWMDLVPAQPSQNSRTSSRLI